MTVKDDMDHEDLVDLIKNVNSPSDEEGYEIRVHKKSDELSIVFFVIFNFHPSFNFRAVIKGNVVYTEAVIKIISEIFIRYNIPYEYDPYHHVPPEVRSALEEDKELF